MGAPWDQALEMRSDMIAFYRSDNGRRALFKMAVEILLGDDPPPTRDMAALSKAVGDFSASLLIKITGEPYYWSPQMCDLLAQVARTVPDDLVLDPEMVPAVDAFMYFAKPIPLLADDEQYQRYLRDEDRAESMYLQVLATGATTQTIGGETYEGLAFSSHVKSREKGTGNTTRIPMPFLSAFWQVSQTWPEQTLERSSDGRLLHIGDRPGNVARDDDMAEQERSGVGDVRRVLIAALTLIAQHVVLPEHATVSRGSRRRYEREQEGAVPEVRVVTLRRPKGTQRYEGTHEPVDWSHRWFVNPHWHAYWYGGRDEAKVMKKRLVLGYVKGPEDKPLVASGLRLFDVKR